MRKRGKLWLCAAAALALSFHSLFVFAGGPGPKVPAASFEALLEAAGGSLAAVPAPAGAPGAGVTAGQTHGPAPAPGKDLSPAVSDALRVKAILGLLSDVYYGKHLPYAQDGAVFSNKEGRLPAQPRGFYREYTLLTGSAPHTVTIGGTTYQVAPDLSARGSERLIIGGGEKVYYTPDHYANFILLAVVY